MAVGDGKWGENGLGWAGLGGACAVREGGKGKGNGEWEWEWRSIGSVTSHSPHLTSLDKWSVEGVRESRSQGIRDVEPTAGDGGRRKGMDGMGWHGMEPKTAERGNARDGQVGINSSPLPLDTNIGHGAWLDGWMGMGTSGVEWEMMGDGRWATDANGHRQRPNHQRGKTEMAETPSPGSAGGTQLGHHHSQSSPVQGMVMVMGMARLMDVRKNLKQMLRRQSRKPRPTTHNPRLKAMRARAIGLGRRRRCAVLCAQKPHGMNDDE